MFESKYSKLLTVILIIAIILIVLIFSLTFLFIMRRGKINQDGEGAVGTFQGQINEEKQNHVLENAVYTNDIAPEIGMENLMTNTITPSEEEETTKMYKGFPMVGTIEIPAINLSCPILQEASAEAIEVAVAVYDGPGLNKIGNTTIVGHNYRDGTFFSNNKKLVEGDKVHITDSTGQKITYSIYKIVTTTPEDSTYLERDTEGKREITLLTCTDDTQSRLLVYAKEQ